MTRSSGNTKIEAFAAFEELSESLGKRVGGTEEQRDIQALELPFPEPSL